MDKNTCREHYHFLLGVKLDKNKQIAHSRFQRYMYSTVFLRRENLCVRIKCVDLKVRIHEINCVSNDRLTKELKYRYICGLVKQFNATLTNFVETLF